MSDSERESEPSTKNRPEASDVNDVNTKTIGEDTGESSAGRKKDRTKLDGPKLQLSSHIGELTRKLELAETALRSEMQREDEVTAANACQRERASALLQEIKDLAQSHSERVLQLLDEELAPGEARIRGRVQRAAQLTEQLRSVSLRAESLLNEDDEAVFTGEFQSLQHRIVKAMQSPLGEKECDYWEFKLLPARVCPKLKLINADLKERLGSIQHSLHNALNPSEVTFDPETAHPNLILSEDLKTVAFSATKQPYPASPQRFTSFLQVLSSQTFSEGDHCWEVELEGSPWIIGVCEGGKLQRSGIPSALESSRSSWCLMWFNNLLTAYERGRSVPLKRTTVSRRLEIRLNFKTHSLSFFNISPSSGKTHVYTFEENLTEPVHLVYRMIAGTPKGRVTILSHS